MRLSQKTACTCPTTHRIGQYTTVFTVHTVAGRRRLSGDFRECQTVPGHSGVLPLVRRHVGRLAAGHMAPVLRRREREYHAIVDDRREQHHQHVEQDVEAPLEGTIVTDRLHQAIEGRIVRVGHGGSSEWITFRPTAN